MDGTLCGRCERWQSSSLPRAPMGASHVPRGSMPGERRGGRTRAAPNRRTILADRIMVVLARCSMASPKQCLSKLVNDAELPADIRMAIAQKAFPDRTGGVRA